jgi:hypothetical protein
MKDLNIEEIKRIVIIRNSPEIIGKFDLNRNKAHKINEIWKEIKEKVNINKTSDEIRETYKELRRGYRLALLKAKQSGEGKPTWKYYDIMNKFSVEGKNLNPESAADSALETSISFLLEEEKMNERQNPKRKNDENLTTKKKINKKENKKDKLYETFEKNNNMFINMLEKIMNNEDDIKMKNIERVENKTKKLNKKITSIKNKMKTMNNKINNISEILGKQVTYFENFFKN